jgi:hypothetical protein
MRVIVVRDRSHVVIDVGLAIENAADHIEEEPMKHVLDVFRRCWIVTLPHHHRNETCFTFSDPTVIVFVETLGQRCRLAQFTQ